MEANGTVTGAPQGNILTEKVESEVILPSDGQKEDVTEEISSVENPKAKNRETFGRNTEAATKAMLKALSELQTPEDKIAALCSRYADLLTEHKQLQLHLKNTTKSQTQLQKEKDKLQTEYNKAVMTKSKLESLCRELQRQNKTVKEESLRRSRDEQNKIREVSDRFQSTISEVQTSMTESSTRNEKLREENADLCKKIKSLIEQYEKREEYVDKLVKTKDYEVQLVEAKLKEMTMVLAEEKERSLVERQKLLTDNIEVRQRCETLTNQVEQSKTQIKMYTDKFDEFQSTLSKSNEVFNNFKGEMDKMGKRIKTLEKETLMWKSKFEGANNSLVKIMEERIAKDKEVATYLNKVQKLEKLCRALQEERNSLNDQNRSMQREISRLKVQTGEEVEEESVTETDVSQAPNSTTEDKTTENDAPEEKPAPECSPDEKSPENSEPQPAEST